MIQTNKKEKNMDINMIIQMAHMIDADVKCKNIAENTKLALDNIDIDDIIGTIARVSIIFKASAYVYENDVLTEQEFSEYIQNLKKARGILCDAIRRHINELNHRHKAIAGAASYVDFDKDALNKLSKEELIEMIKQLKK